MPLRSATDPWYWECHITIAPVDEDKRELLQQHVAEFGFKLAKLLMQKGQPSQLDTFMTAHGQTFDELCDRMFNAVRRLQHCGIPVRRYKIESCPLDSRNEDTLQLLKGT